MWDRLLIAFLRFGVRTGTVHLTLPDGATHHIGPGGGPDVAVTLHDPQFSRKFFVRPDLTMGEAYMDGRLTITNDDIRSLIAFALRNARGRKVWPPFRQIATLAARAKSWSIWNHVGIARRNVAHHYDISDELYDLFLGDTKQYTCAYFRRPDMTLEEAQEAKKAHIGKKLLIEPGMKALDIGSGWGGLSMTLAKDHGARMTGVTLSTEQLALARERVAAAGLEGQVEFRLTDYRDLNETFDRIVSVGMLEHVGAPQFATYFQTLKRLLADDGVAVIHSIGRASGKGATNAFTNKYIFPGGYIPGLSEIVKAIEEAGLWITDIEILRLHYAETLKHWRLRFMADPEIPALFDARFRRMWEFYLAGAEMGFRYGGHMVFQIQVAKKRDAVPLTRDYMAGA